jgi:DnaJ-class molecular chaperone
MYSRITAEADMMNSCPECDGSDVIDEGTDDEQQCPTCGGSGVVPDDDDDDDEVIRTIPRRG